MSARSSRRRSACRGIARLREALRDLVETVTVFRDPSRAGGVEVEIAGRLNALLGEKAYPNRVRECGESW